METYSEPSQTRTKVFVKLVNGFKLLTVFLQRALSEMFGGILNTSLV